MNQINPKDLKIINSLPPIAKRGEKISVDSEFFGQTKSRLHRPHGTFAYLGCSFDGVTIYYITDETQIQEFLDKLNLGVWIFHHAKYDVTQLRRFAPIPTRKLLWDTMLIEQIMWSGYYTDFGLNDLARRYLSIYMPKEVRKEFSEGDTVSEMTREQIEYASIDVAATWRIYKAQRAIIDETDLEIWKNIELPFLWTLLSMGGIKLDTEKWITLAEKNENTAKEIQLNYGQWIEVQGKRSTKQIFDGLNLNSPKQVKDYLKSCGWKVDSTDVEALEKIANSGDEDDAGVRFANELLVYRNCSKRASTYGKKFIEDYVEDDGKIYADMYQIGAETARTSCRAPNLQNQPHEKEYRECFIADEGNCLIVADYGSQEPRIAAYLSQDEGLIKALNGKEKLYIAIARDVLGKTITKESPEYGHIKSTILGIFYGMSAYGLSTRIGVSVEEAEDMIHKILETYPGIYDYMQKQRKAGDYVTSIYGRKIWLNKYSYQWERNALNAPIQSSAADATKLAAFRFVDACDEGIYQDSPLRLIVHDEIVVEDNLGNCDWTKKLLERVMIEVAEEMHEGIKGVAEVFHGQNWACKS